MDQRVLHYLRIHTCQFGSSMNKLYIADRYDTSTVHWTRPEMLIFSPTLIRNTTKNKAVVEPPSIPQSVGPQLQDLPQALPQARGKSEKEQS